VLSVSRKKAGATITCPACKASTKVPELESPPAPSVQSPPAVEAPWESEPESPAAAPIAETRPAAQPFAIESKSPAASSMSGPHLLDDDDDDEDEVYVRKSHVEKDAIDMTAMVDVTFLLLIFFMVTASFAAQKVMETTAPDPEESADGVGAVSSVDSDEEMADISVVIAIDANDRITVDDQPVSGLAELRDVLASKASGGGTAEGLLQYNYSARHGIVVSVADAVVSAGMIVKRQPQADED
jgi:biopolymer transport protein ExbD